MKQVALNKCHKQKFWVLFVTCIKPVVRVLACVCNCTDQMKKTGKIVALHPLMQIVDVTAEIKLIVY